ncbi:MAG: Hsp70 family protein [Thermodesulfobacteriota bacterium]|nr:Hsp70 family protein [Thermodesulfobacteriota bacterium]
MARATIDFGIDLGTTNSSIAVWKGTGGYELIKNNDNVEYTPSVVWINKKNNLYVGLLAKQQLELDVENAFAAFKRQMGTDAKYHFIRSGRWIKPEELSAEVLKELKKYATRSLGEDVQAAVITVPAAFELPQCEATDRAAKLAGISTSILLQEPVAAGLAYGFQSESDKVFWLVYDFGGGTFDAAVIQVRDGLIQIVNHGGDNFLGGGDIDYAIADQILAPAIIKEFRISDFNRGNKSWRSAFAKLKWAAEAAKIRLSNIESVPINIDNLFAGCPGFKDGPVEFNFDLERIAIEPLIEPLVEQSANICKKVLTEKRLAPADIEKVLLVGGPTLTPYLRDRLADPNMGLGISLEFHIDPLTVVAAGAAIFAGTQRIECIAPSATPNQYTIELDYKPVGSSTEPDVGGKVLALKGENLSGFTIEFTNIEARPQWRSGKINLSSTGSFMTTLWAEKGHPNTFLIELFSSTGAKCKTVPDRINYTIGLVFTSPPLTHSIGVAKANNEVRRIFEKGTPLPAKKRITDLKTAYLAKAAQDPIIIPLVEGENRKGDRNIKIGNLIIKPEQIKRDVPPGSEVEITVDIDQSRLIRAKAYIPVLDEEFEDVQTLVKESSDLKKLQEVIDQEKKRLAEVREKAQQIEDSKAQHSLQKIERENVENNLDSLLIAASADRDAVNQCHKKLLDFKAAIDEVEDALELPSLLSEAKEAIKFANDIVEQYGNSKDKQNFKILEHETYKATQSHNIDFLQTKVSELRDTAFRLLREQPNFWVSWFQYLEKEKTVMRDHAQAELLLNQGRRAMENQDLQSLQAAVRQLYALLPVEQQRDGQKAFGSTVI